MTDHNHHEPHGHDHGHDHDHGTVSEPIPLRPRGAALDWERVRERLADETGPRYWRSLDELADSPEFQAMIHREFPTNASEWLDPMGRRSFLKLMGASLGLAGLAACTRQPSEKIMPYVRAPEELIPGKALYYATSFPFNGYGIGVLAESHEGRPTKIEGNALHPASLGATDVFTQASILNLYDPDRSKVLTNGGRVATWEQFQVAIEEASRRWKSTQGAGLRILTDTVTSPTLADQLAQIQKLLPQAKWHQYEPVNNDNVLRGAELAFGKPASTRYDFSKAEVVLSLDCDFLQGEPGSIRYARDFANARRASSESKKMNRLYVVEPTPTLTGGMGDHRLRVRRSQIEGIARTIARQVGAIQEAPDTGAAHAKWIDAVIADLTSHKGASLVIAGRSQPPVVHAIAHALNAMLGNVGKTVTYAAPVEAKPAGQLDDLTQLVRDMDAGLVDTLIVLNSNPVYGAPADLGLSEVVDGKGKVIPSSPLRKLRLAIHLGLYEDETAAYCHWHVPATHYLESWSDVRAYDGTVSIVQPLIEPLFNGKSAHDLLSLMTAALGAPTPANGYEIVREYWRRQKPEGFESFWRKALHDGLVAGSALPAIDVPSPIDRIKAIPATPAGATGAYEVVFNPDPTLWDGRYATNGWLQECPKPFTKLTWDNAVLVGPKAAQNLGLATEQVVTVQVDGRGVEGAVFILPGQPDDVITLHLGSGRTRTGRVGLAVGFDAGRVRTSANFWAAPGATIEKAGRTYELAITDKHHNMEGRELVRSATLADFIRKPDFAQDHGKHLSLLPEWKKETYAWGMAINQNVCIGCNACVVACQAENNVPVVGKEQVIAQREMHWLRIDTYYAGSPDDPEETLFQPMACQHCEKAPCEIVCPVAATVHSAEGLNQMVYNRCVGTRYCSNNCPYKVRRFNFLYFTANLNNQPTLKMLQNPDVTVRTRGVMEKCTYCTQRISAARINAQKENRDLRDGEVTTACQQACPTQAIVFGDINDPNSAVSKLKREPLNYGVLTELNTQPRTTYLAKLSNPNPALATEKPATGKSESHEHA